MNGTTPIQPKDSIEIYVRFDLNTGADKGKTIAACLEQLETALQEKYDDGTLAGNFVPYMILANGILVDTNFD